MIFRREENSNSNDSNNQQIEMFKHCLMMMNISAVAVPSFLFGLAMRLIAIKFNLN